jgi:uncharacterized protein YodC (DUF2158 family)
MSQFKIGDVVRLKSGGCKMTVTGTDPYNGRPRIWCAWFEKTKKADGFFPPEALQLVKRTSNSNDAD